MKKLFLITAVLFSTLSLAQDLEWDSSKSFDVVFDIDSASTVDGEDWQMAISGQAGPYGMAYGSITFSNFSTDETQGEYFGIFSLKFKTSFLEAPPMEFGKKKTENSSQLPWTMTRLVA